MDNFETESNCSYYSDSLQSNASSLSGLSLYGNEFAELRHLVNPAKYPEPYLERSSTPRPELTPDIENDKVQSVKNELQRSLELNEHNKLELQNVERKIELTFCDKIDKLLRTNSRLEGELQNANTQIERLIKTYKDKHDYSVIKGKLDLEKRIYKLTLDHSLLEKHCAKIQQEKNETDLENKSLKITIAEVFIERDIKNSSIQSLKQKISEQHIEIQNSLKNKNNLIEKFNLLSTNLAELEKSKAWYKEQLSVCQNEKLKYKEDLTKCRNHVNELSENVSGLNIELTKYKNEVDIVRLNALKEKEELFKKLEKINLDCTVLRSVSPTSDTSEYDLKFYEQTIQDLKDEISRIKTAISDKDTQLEKLTHENSNAISKCLVLQKTLAQKEDNIELLESAKHDLLRKVDYLKDNEKGQLNENMQLKNKVGELEIEVKMRQRETQEVEESISLIRDQFFMFKQNYEKVKNELHSRNKIILQLQKDKQELFMNNNWTICELEKLKHKDILIEDLKKENQALINNVAALKQDIKTQARENVVNLNNTIEKYKSMISEYEEKYCHLEGEFKKASDTLLSLTHAYNDTKMDIANKDSELTESCRTIEQLHLENNRFLASHTSEMQIKDESISYLKNKLKKLENDWQSYLKRITDDQKVELLLNNRSNLFSAKNIENYVLNFFDELNVEEFHSSVDIRLKYFDERINKIKEKSGQLQEAIKSQAGDNRVKELEILLQVKERDMQEKRKKMDKNNRTLLRKVKEHMRGRNLAEKQLKYLQDMYNTLADDHNTSKLALCAREHEIQCLEEFCNGYKREIEKLRNTIGNLEQELARAKNCSQCIEVDFVKEKLVYFEKLYNDLEKELECSRGQISLLSKQNEEQDIKNKAQTHQIEDILMKNEKLQVSLSKLQNIDKESLYQKESIKKLENIIEESERLHQKSLDDIRKLNQDLTEANEKIQIHSSNLQQKVEYSQELEDKLVKLEGELVEYRQRMLSLQNDLKFLHNDKFFLQRLSSDLKVALNSYADHNRKLQEQLKLLTVEKKLFKTLPINVSFSGKYDDHHIRKLLEENRGPSGRKPVTAEIRGCLDKLREEIYSLQDQISKKNIVGISSNV